MLYKNLFKRLFDVAGVILLAPVVVIFGIPVAIAIKLNDGGPVFYKSIRLGRNAEPFEMLKFRSMAVNAPDIRNEDGSTFNANNDPRVTRVGKFIRSTSLDELPQLWNVLVGDMSFIGPRPSPTGNMDKYPDWYLEKFKIRPGLTGLAQAKYRNSASLEERYRTDIEYTQNVSLRMDIKIFLITLESVLKRKNINADHQDTEVNDSDRTLLLLTNYFPYHRGEEYLLSEFPHLEQKFDKIVVIPVMHKAGMKKTYEERSNVVVITPNMPSSTLRKGFYVLLNSPKVLFSKGFWRGCNKKSPLKFAYDLYFAARTEELYKQVHDDVRKEIGRSHVTVYSYRLYVTALLGSWLSDRLNLNVVSRVSRAHRYDLYEDISRLDHLPFRNYLLAQYDYILPVSAQGRDYILDNYSIEDKRVIVERLGVIGSSEINRELSDDIHIVSVSTFNPVKRVELIAQLVERLRQLGANVKWTHFGKGPENEEEHVRDYVKTHDLENLVSFGGYINNEQLLEWYANNDVTFFVNLSTSEGVPVSIMEAMASSIPVLATDVGGTGEIVKDGRNGFLVDASADVDVLATKLLEATRHPSNYAALSHGAFETWQADWNAEKNYASFAQKIYDTDWISE